MTQITQTISEHPVLQKDRAIRVKEIAYINFDIFEARVTWEELYIDTEGNLITDKTVARRTIVSDISNASTVTEHGIVIDSTNFPKQEDESDEDYQKRIDDLKAKGFPEFDFYIGMILNTEAIKQAIGVLDQLQRFNRE